MVRKDAPSKGGNDDGILERYTYWDGHFPAIANSHQRQQSSLHTFKQTTRTHTCVVGLWSVKYIIVLAVADAATVDANAAGAVVAAPPIFTLAPALANIGIFLDLTSVSGSKHFKGATEPLKAQPFDFVDASDLQVFLDLVLKKSQVWGWNTIFTIPVTDPVIVATTNHNLLTQYGLIPLVAVRTQVLTYYHTPTKHAQDSFMACQCLMSSLSLDFLKLITSESSD
jgi:hypothetical protein